MLHIHHSFSFPLFYFFVAILFWPWKDQLTFNRFFVFVNVFSVFHSVYFNIKILCNILQIMIIFLIRLEPLIFSHVSKTFLLAYVRPSCLQLYQDAFDKICILLLLLPVDPRDLISEKFCAWVNGYREIIFRSHLQCVLILKYDVCHFKDNFTNQ